MHNFRNLEIWRKAIALSTEVYSVTKSFPASEQFGLTSQIQRAVVSVAANIAEGSARSSNKEFVHFLEFSLGSLYELETELIVANNVGILDQSKFDNLSNKMTELEKMILSFKFTLQK
jgi:four helix bundle protein